MNITSGSYLVSASRDSAYRGYSIEMMNGVIFREKVSLGFLTGLTILSRNPYGERNWLSIPLQVHCGYFPEGRMKFCWEGNFGYHLTIPNKEVPRNVYGSIVEGIWCLGSNAGVRAKMGKASSFVMMLGYRIQSYARTGYTYDTNSTYHLGFAQLKCGLVI